MTNIDIASNAGLIFYWFIDTDDNTAPSTAQEMREAGQVKRKVLYGNQSRSVNIKLRPRTNMALYNNAIASGYGPRYKSTWIDTRSPGVQHYGLKCGWSTELNPLNIDQIWAVEITYYVTFRGVQ